jgi:hypothetical protein
MYLPYNQPHQQGRFSEVQRPTLWLAHTQQQQFGQTQDRGSPAPFAQREKVEGSARSFSGYAKTTLW